MTSPALPPLAEPADVAVLLGRALDAQETALAETLLATVLRRIQVRIPDLAERIADGKINPDAVIAVQAAAVARVLKNPDGYRSEGAGEFSYTIDTRAAAGFLTILDDEWAELGVSRTAFATPVTDGYAAARMGVTDPSKLFQYAWPARDDLAQWWFP